MPHDLKSDTLAAQALGWVDPASDALEPSIHPSTSFLRDPLDLDRAGRRFTRDDNPTYPRAEALLNKLEQGAGCLLFASGMAAATAILETLGPGDHVVVPRALYSGLRHWLRTHGARWGLRVEAPESDETDALQRMLRPGETRLVWIETPSNPLWRITDIAAVAAAAHAVGAVVAADNTVATPILTNPIALGVDLVLHSASKYLNGHADVVAGALIVAPGREDLLERLRMIRDAYGAVLGPFEAWLLLRGIRTLHLRMARSCASAETIAHWLKSHPKVLDTLYPGLPSHPGHEIAARQMRGGFGAMLSFRLRDEQMALQAAAAVRVVRQAISFGGLETIIEHRAGMEGPDSPVPRDLLRLSVGVEAVEDLIADLDQALEMAR